MNYLGSIVVNDGYITVPSNTNAIIAVYDCPISEVLVTPTINGTAVTNRFSFTSFVGVPGMIAEMNPAPPAGTYLTSGDWNVGYFFFSGAGTLRSTGTAGILPVNALDIVNATLISDDSEYVIGMMSANTGGQPTSLKIDNGAFNVPAYTVSYRILGTHSSNGTVADLDMTIGSGGAGTLWFGFSSVTSLTPLDRSGGVVAIM
jgi:hypothetical protein